MSSSTNPTPVSSSAPSNSAAATGGGVHSASESDTESKGLRDWWNRFKQQQKPSNTSQQTTTGEPGAAGGKSRIGAGGGSEATGTEDESTGHGKDGGPVFGSPLSLAIRRASITISTPSPQSGQFYSWGVIPTFLARSGRYLKENATEIEGTFRVSGSTKRMKDLQAIFDSPPRYGKDINWDEVPHTTHDVATLFRRFLTMMPEPVVPIASYDAFREPFKNTTSPLTEEQKVKTYLDLIKVLPPSNQYLLLYVLDFLSVFEKKAEKNLMTAGNLAVIFQPGILSHSDHHMVSEEYKLNQEVVEFLILHVDDFQPLLEGRLQTNPYRRHVGKKTTPKKQASDSSADMIPPISTANVNFPAESSTSPTAKTKSSLSRPEPPPRSQRLSDTMAASESDDDFPDGVVLMKNDNGFTKPRTQSFGGLGRSKSIGGKSNASRSSAGSKNTTTNNSRSTSSAASPTTALGLGMTPSGGDVDQPDTPRSTSSSMSSVRRRATAPSRRSGGGGDGATIVAGTRRRERDNLRKSQGDQQAKPIAV